MSSGMRRKCGRAGAFPWGSEADQIAGGPWITDRNPLSGTRQVARVPRQPGRLLPITSKSMPPSARGKDLEDTRGKSC